MRSCGVGLGSDENAARRDAFKNAKTEFAALCRVSDDCEGREVTVSPERTSCEPQSGGGYKCYRLLVFNIGDKTDKPRPLELEPESEPEPVARGNNSYQRLLPVPTPEPEKEEPPPVVAEPEPQPVKEEIVEARPLGKPFRPAEGAKIRVGMTKTEVLDQFGRPDVVRENPFNVAVFYRGRSFCHGGTCMFRFEKESGRVVVYQDFRVEFTDALN